MAKFFQEAFETGQQVRIIKGHDRGKVGFYLGLKNNSNWHVVDVDGFELLLNKDELEAYEP